MPRWIDAEALPVRDLWVHDEKVGSWPVRAVMMSDIEKAEELQGAGWIPVTPKTLPPEGDGVFAVVTGSSGNLQFDDAVELAEWYSDDGWTLVNYPEWRGTVSYWMPVPQLPAGGKS